MWQAYVDESFDEKLFVMGGFVAPAEVWSDFVDEWTELLPYIGLRADDGTFEFKMAEMAQNNERMERAQAAFRIIENRLSFGTLLSLRLIDLAKARRRLVVLRRDGAPVKVNLGFLANDYKFAFNIFLREFYQREDVIRQNFHLPDGQKVDFIFDERMHDKKEILTTWEEWKSGLKQRDLVGTTPRFEDSNEFKPLQAADFICWWVRKWLHQSSVREIEDMPLPWRRRGRLGFSHSYMDEEMILDFMINVIRKSVDENTIVCDANTLVKNSLRP